MAGLHHVEIWVGDFSEASETWGWLLNRLGWSMLSEWPGGQSWGADGVYITLTTSPTLSSRVHDRRSPGMNHLAFTGGTAANVDAIMAEASDHGWRALYQDRYPHAGGAAHYAGWVENAAGFKAEIVAQTD